jgi:hypothetical protein
MASAIDITKPVAGNPLTATVRANFTAAASEITALQAAQALKAPLAAPDLTGAATAVGLTVSGTLDATGAFQLNSVAVTSTAAELNILDGVTATAAELNILDGVTATAAELNFSDGVTSNIQTQLDTKTGDQDKADIDALNITNLGTVVGFTSTGVDDNATSTAITIDSSENVGIGTASPNYILDIQGALGSFGFSPTSNYPILFIKDDVTTGAGAKGEIRFLDSSDDLSGQIGFLGGGTTLYLRSRNAAGDIRFATGGTSDRVVIDSSGNVGIGTASPSKPLEVLSGTTAGVTLPSSYSTIVADGTNAGLTLTATGTGFAGLNWANDSGANDANIVVKSSDREMRFIVAAAERMRIKSDGVINFSDMPTASAGLASGDLWSDSGTIKIVA